MTTLPLSGKKVLIILGPSFEDSEVVYPFYRFKEAGATVVLAGIGESLYKGKHGVPLTVDVQVEQCEQEMWDAVIIPGGWAPDKIRMNQAALNIVRTAHQQGRLVAAICHGGWVLVSAEILAGRRVTSYRAIRPDMTNAGAEWVDEEVVMDKNLVTSRTPADLPAFCRALVEALSAVSVAV